MTYENICLNESLDRIKELSEKDASEAALTEERTAIFQQVHQELCREVELGRNKTAIVNQILSDYTKGMALVNQRKVMLEGRLVQNARKLEVVRNSKKFIMNKWNAAIQGWVAQDRKVTGEWEG